MPPQSVLDCLNSYVLIHDHMSIFRPVFNNLRFIGVRLARPDILFWTLPLLMVIVVVGTVAQKDLGLLKSQQLYFSSWLIWFGFVPFPGGMTLLVIFFVNLLMKFLLFSEWAWHKAGIIITHFGVLLLLLGGLFTALTQEEGYLVIEQGSQATIIKDYHQRELQIYRDGDRVITMPHQALHRGLELSDPALPFKMNIDTYCYNCKIQRRAEADQADWVPPGKFMQLVPTDASPSDEENLTGIEFTIQGSGATDGKYLTFDAFPKPPELEVGGHSYKITIDRSERTLPFTVQLDKFERELHPGTSMASAYHSLVTVLDGDTKWTASIRMNEPLRYRGYTLYQSSFDLSGEKPFTVLSVVRNTGRLFPYISSLIMAAGLILHLIIRLRRKVTT